MPGPCRSRAPRLFCESRDSESVTLPPGSVYLAALSIRLPTICASRASSPSTQTASCWQQHGKKVPTIHPRLCGLRRLL